MTDLIKTTTVHLADRSDREIAMEVLGKPRGYLIIEICDGCYGEDIICDILKAKSEVELLRAAREAQGKIVECIIRSIGFNRSPAGE